MTDIHSGACLCGAVTFEVAGELREVVYCHCGQCRRQTGLYYASTNAADKDLTVKGAENITWYHSSEKGRRGFCKHCGSALFWHRTGAPRMAVAAGSLDQPTGLKVVEHIYVEDKADYETIADGLSQLTGSQFG